MEDTDCNASQECVAFIKWNSLDEMYDVKRDDDSLFNNGFVPLKAEATKGSTSVLYIKLREARADRSPCLMM